MKVEKRFLFVGDNPGEEFELLVKGVNTEKEMDKLVTRYWKSSDAEYDYEVFMNWLTSKGFDAREPDDVITVDWCG